jgi:hypothetical protein
MPALDPAALLRLLGLSAASGTRGALVLVVLGLSGRWLGLPLEGPWAALTRPEVLGALGAVALFEAWAERDDDLRSLTALALTGVQAASGGVAGLALADRLPPWAAGALGVGVALAVSLLRGQVHRLLAAARTEVADPRRWLTRLEGGGALGVAVAALLAPVLAVALVVAAALIGLGVARAARVVEAAWRRPCPACGASIRVEASRCPRCRGEVEPAWLRGDGAAAAPGPAPGA